MTGESTHSTGSGRGQLVLIAAVALAMALVPLVLAYLQLGYHDDIRPSGDVDPAGQAERTLTHDLHDASAGIEANYSWTDRDAAVATVRDRLRSTIEAVNRSRLAAGQASRVTYNQSRADQWRRTNCPGGPDRQFGACKARAGVVMQNRANRTHVLAVAFDVAISTPDTDTQVTLVVRRP
jgi:hypothetical protein